jgi:sarcosine oxidase subunit gamma
MSDQVQNMSLPASRGALYEIQLTHGAVMETRGGGELVSAFPASYPARDGTGLALVDYGGAARWGIRGRNTLEWLSGAGFEFESRPNEMFVQNDGARVMVLAPGEALILPNDRCQSNAIDGMIGDLAASPEGGVYSVPRRDQSIWLRLVGPQSADCLAKLCAVDLRAHAFQEGKIAQTSVASMSAIVAREDYLGNTAFHILVDRSFAQCFWDYLLDAIAEYGGAAVGLAQLEANL